MTQIVRFVKESGATTAGQYKWIAEIFIGYILVARAEFENPADAWEWIYSYE